MNAKHIAEVMATAKKLFDESIAESGHGSDLFKPSAEDIAKDLYEASLLFVKYDANDNEDGIQMMLDYAKAIKAAKAACAAYETAHTIDLEKP